MTDVADPVDIAVVESGTLASDSFEYDVSMIAHAALTGPRGSLRIRRRYYALPRHNDVTDPTGSDSNDELLDRADEFYVHTKFYEITGDGDDYFLDRLETWRPDDPMALADETAFVEACEAHHLANLRSDYVDAMDERPRTTGASG